MKISFSDFSIDKIRTCGYNINCSQQELQKIRKVIKMFDIWNFIGSLIGAFLGNLIAYFLKIFFDIFK